MKIKLNKQVQHNDKTYKVDSIVDFNEKDAKALTARGFAVEVKESTKSTTQPAEEPKKEETKAETKQPAKAVVKKVAATKSTTKKAN